jgi:NADPH:quinone reductase-like Zn-dependent oxidoreductase
MAMQIPTTMRAARLQAPGSTEHVVVTEVEVPTPASGEVLVRVEAAAVTRDELTWPEDRLPATPSYEVAGIVAAIGPDVADLQIGDDVFALMDFGRDGAAAEYALVAADLLARRAASLDAIHNACLPMGGLSSWQGLIDHGRLESGHRVLITGPAGGVGHLAVQLATSRGADVVDPDAEETLDLVFDTVGGETVSAVSSRIRPGGRLVSIAEEPPRPEGIEAVYFVVEPGGRQLEEVRRLADTGVLVPEVDSVFPLDQARSAFERAQARGKHGKVVLQVREPGS